MKKPKVSSPRGRIKPSDYPSLIKSALISLVAVMAVIGLKYLFPTEDFSDLQKIVLTGVSGFIANLIYVTVREK